MLKIITDSASDLPKSYVEKHGLHVIPTPVVIDEVDYFDGDTIQVGTAKVKKVDPFLVGALKVDTVKLGRITFPICYAGTEAKPNIKVMHSVNSFLSSYKKKYEQVLRVANIILEPVAMEEDE